MDLVKYQNVRQLFNKSICMSIECKRTLISFDLITFAKSNGFQLAIFEQQMQLLIQWEMYELIERLVLSNSLLKIDKSELDIEDLMQAERIKSKKTKAAKELEQEENANKNNEGGDLEFEGGGRKKRNQRPTSTSLSDIDNELRELERKKSN